MANERTVLMTLSGIVRMVLFGFLVPGVAAQMPPQSPASPGRGAEQSSRLSQAQPQAELKRFFLLSRASIDVSPDWFEPAQKPLPPSPRLARAAPQMAVLGFIRFANPKM